MTPMGTCTAFAIDTHKVMTNNHCVQNEDTEQVATSKQLHLYFKNPGDKATTEVAVASILEHQAADSDDYFLQRMEASVDWAILETTVDVSEFMPAKLIRII